MDGFQTLKQYQLTKFHELYAWNIGRLHFAASKVRIKPAKHEGDRILVKGKFQRKFFSSSTSTLRPGHFHRDHVSWQTSEFGEENYELSWTSCFQRKPEKQPSYPTTLPDGCKNTQGIAVTHSCWKPTVNASWYRLSSQVFWQGKTFFFFDLLYYTVHNHKTYML